MKTKKIGIVLEKIKLCRISGYFATLQIKLEFGEFNNIVVNDEIKKVYFDYYPKSGYYEIAIGTFEDGQQIGKELKELGVENLKFKFNDKMYDVL